MPCKLVLLFAASLCLAIDPRTEVSAEDAPIAVVEDTGKLNLVTGRALAMRSKTNVYRTAVADGSVCDVVQFSSRELSLIARKTGQTTIRIWTKDSSSPVSYLVEVTP